MLYKTRLVLFIICLLIGFSLSSCHQQSLSMGSDKVYRQIDQNPQLTSEERSFAKRYFRFCWKYITSPLDPHFDQISPLWLQKQAKGPWGLPDASTPNVEEKVYLLNIDKMRESWDEYNRIDLHKLNPGEQEFLQNVHQFHGQRVDYRAVLKKQQGTLTSDQEHTLDLAESLSGQTEFDDRALIFLYRKGTTNVLNASESISRILPKHYARKLRRVSRCPDGTFILISYEHDSSRPGGTSWLYHGIRCNSMGEILKIQGINPVLGQYFPQQDGDMIGNPCDTSPSWIWSALKTPTMIDMLAHRDSKLDDRFYKGNLSKDGLHAEVVLSTQGTQQRFKRWWYIQGEEADSLFIVVSESRTPRNAPSNRKILPGECEFHFLRHYEYRNAKLTFVGESPIDNEDREATDFALGIDRGEYYLWVIDLSRFSPTRDNSELDPQNNLRVAKWKTNGDLAWTVCVEGGCLCSLEVNLLAASAARVSLKKFPGDVEYPQDLLVAIQDNSIRKTILNARGGYWQGITSLGETGKWAVVTHEESATPFFVTFLDTDLSRLGEFKIIESEEFGFGLIWDAHLVYDNGKLFLVFLKGEGKDSVFVKQIEHPAMGN